MQYMNTYRRRHQTNNHKCPNKANRPHLTADKSSILPVFLFQQFRLKSNNQYLMNLVRVGKHRSQQGETSHVYEEEEEK